MHHRTRMRLNLLESPRPDPPSHSGHLGESITTYPVFAPNVRLELGCAPRPEQKVANCRQRVIVARLSPFPASPDACSRTTTEGCFYHDSVTFPVLSRHRLKVENSDMSLLLDTADTDSIELDPSSSYIRRHQSSSVTDGDTSLPTAPLLASGTTIVVDTTQPLVTGVYGVNGDGKPG